MVSGEAQPSAQPSLRGRVRRRDMPDAEAREFLTKQAVAHVATVGSDGWPYVVPLVYVYEGGDILYLHTGARPGHFLSNIKNDNRVCLEVSTMGPLIPGPRHACTSALIYTSAIVYGHLTIIEDADMKTWFFDQLMAKHGDPTWTFEPGYPAAPYIILYEMKIETLTAKHSVGFHH